MRVHDLRIVESHHFAMIEEKSVNAR